MNEPMVFDESAVALIRRILYAASTDHRREPLMGIRFDGETAMTTDSYRLALAHFDTEPLPAITFPVKGLRSLMPRKGDWSPNGLEPIEGIYPNWRPLVENCRWTWALRYERVSLLDACTELLAERKPDGAVVGLLDAPILPYRVGPRDEVPGPIAGAMSVASGKSEGWTGEVVWLNAKFLAEMMKASQLDVVTLECDGPYRPVMLREPGLTQLLMPVRVS